MPIKNQRRITKKESRKTRKNVQIDNNLDWKHKTERSQIDNNQQKPRPKHKPKSKLIPKTKTQPKTQTQLET